MPERRASVLARQTAKKSTEVGACSSERPQRFAAKGLVSLRARLGLSAPKLARLISVSDQSIYNWERKKTTPRKEQLAKIAALRGLGRREVRAQLDALDHQDGRKPRTRA